MGSTDTRMVDDAEVQDHPHIHGEHLYICTKSPDVLGSPPYTWGALDAFHPRFRLTGITPIYMGSTPLGALDLDR